MISRYEYILPKTQAGGTLEDKCLYIYFWRKKGQGPCKGQVLLISSNGSVDAVGMAPTAVESSLDVSLQVFYREIKILLNIRGTPRGLLGVQQKSYSQSNCQSIVSVCIIRQWTQQYTQTACAGHGSLRIDHFPNYAGNDHYAHVLWKLPPHDSLEHFAEEAKLATHDHYGWMQLGFYNICNIILLCQANLLTCCTNPRLNLPNFSFLLH